MRFMLSKIARFVVVFASLIGIMAYPISGLAASSKSKNANAAAVKTNPAQSYNLQYQAYWGGIEAANMELSISETKSDYSGQFNFRTKGLINKLWKFNVTAESHGLFNSPTPAPRVFAANSTLRNKQKRYAWNFDPKNKLARTTDDPAIEKTIGEEWRRGVFDPIGAIQQLRAMVRTAKSSAQLKSVAGQIVPIFDGRKRFDLILQSVSTREEKIGGKNYALIDLAARIDPKAGFKDRDLDGWKSSKITLSLADDGMYFPVKIQIDTDWATAVIRLTGGCVGHNCAQTNL